MGARVLQSVVSRLVFSCQERVERDIRPHQGAKNSTRAGFPDFKISSSKLSGTRSITAEAAFAPAMTERPAAMIDCNLIVVYCVFCGCGGVEGSNVKCS